MITAWGAIDSDYWGAIDNDYWGAVYVITGEL